ncbi:MAG: zf-HC2 domain-containing protein [Nitriliruptoraceae bacterium]|nr:zf-HC2 domain-containing protein [Nitriliruptoraceae bacterium]
MHEQRLRCRQVRRALQSYLDGELEHAPAEGVAAHLADCPRCGIDAATLREVIARIRARRPDIDLSALRRTVDALDDLLHDG